MSEKPIGFFFEKDGVLTMIDVVLRRLYRGRNIKAFLISLCLHITVFIVLAFTLYSQKPVKSEDVVQFSFVDAAQIRPERPKPSMPPKITRLNPTKRETLPKDSEKMMRMDESANKFDEVIAQAPVRLTRSATIERHAEKVTKLPDVMTIAEGLKEDIVSLSRQVSTRNAPEAGSGMSSFRQRVSGSGSGGLSMVQTTGAAVDGGILPSQGEGDTSIVLSDEPPIDEGPFGDALFKIGQHIVEMNQIGSADVVFVLDTSVSMQDNIQQVADHLFSMTDNYDKAGLDYRLGFVRFSVQRQGNKIEIDPLTPDVKLLQRRMKKNVRISGDEHAIDALWNTLTYMQFRPGVEKHLVLVTDEIATTGWRKKNAYIQRSNWILQTCERLNITAHVLGYNEYFQRSLAARTNGLWQEIPGGQRLSSVAAQDTGLPASPRSNQKLLKSFREIARHIARTAGGGMARNSKAKTPTTRADIIVIIDYSRSMSGKVEALRQGLNEFFNTLKLFPLDYTFGVIRFAQGSNTSVSVNGTAVIQPPIDEEGIMNIFTIPFGGDEHLIDAIVEGLPKIRFRDARRVVLIITDEPSTGNYDVSEALNICQTLNAQVNVLGPLPSGATEAMIAQNIPLPGKDFQILAVRQTGGTFRAMPNSLTFADANQ